MKAWEKYYLAALMAFAFLSRIPVGIIFGKKLDNFYRTANSVDMKAVSAKSLLFYPLVGLVLGILLYAIMLLASQYLNLPDMLVAAIVLIAWVKLTGALHLDGVADMADAWVGGMLVNSDEGTCEQHKQAVKEKTLAIMKDSLVGPNAVVSLLLLLIIKLALVYSLLTSNQLLLIIPALFVARSLILAWLYFVPYIRENGLGKDLKPELNFIEIVLLKLLGLVVLLTLMPSLISLVISLLVITAFFFYFRHRVMARLGGTTGDIMGALIEYGETVFLLSAVVVLSF